MKALKTTDLMVGDIIRYADQDKPQKATIDTLHAIKEGAKVVGVELTEEHLSNIFRKEVYDDCNQRAQYINDDYRYDIKIYLKGEMDYCHRLIIGDEDFDQYLSIYCLYVHELQHALRLVGLAKIADNLKM